MMMLRPIRLLGVSLTLAAALPAQPTLLTNVGSSGAAIDGYDPVAYFTGQKAVPGSPAHSFEWNGATWRFASAANRDLFARDPERYAPQYGGYCAYGMSRGYKAKIEPQAFTVVDNKLYLNYNNKVQDMWRKDTAGYIRKADANWPKVKDSAEVHR